MVIVKLPSKCNWRLKQFPKKTREAVQKFVLDIQKTVDFADLGFIKMYLLKNIYLSHKFIRTTNTQNNLVQHRCT